MQIPSETLRDVQTDASADTRSDTLAELKSKKVSKTLTDVKITDVNTKTVAKRLGNVEVEALADTSPEMLSQAVAKTIADTLTCVKAKSRSKTSDTVADVEAYIDIKTLNEVTAKPLVFTQAYKFTKV